MPKNNEIIIIIKAVNSLENRGILLKENTKKSLSQKGELFGFLGRLINVGLPLMKNVLTTLAESVLIPLRSTAVASHFEIRKYYEKKNKKKRNEPKFNNVYSRSNLPKIKDEAYIINLFEYKSVGTHWVALYVSGEKVQIPIEIKKFITNKNFAKKYL